MIHTSHKQRVGIHSTEAAPFFPLECAEALPASLSSFYLSTQTPLSYHNHPSIFFAISLRICDKCAMSRGESEGDAFNTRNHNPTLLNLHTKSSEMANPKKNPTNAKKDAIPKSMQPMASNNDTERIKNRLESGATASEIASEAYRVCRMNAYIRRDLAQIRQEVRDDKKKKVAQEDALTELRRELPATQKMLERAWSLLQSRKVKIPDDMKTVYAGLTEKDPHDWQASKGHKAQKGAAKEKKQPDKPMTKAEKKAARAKAKQEKSEKKQTTFLLHEPDGETYDARKPITTAEEPEEADDDGEPTAEELAAAEHVDFMKNGSSYCPLPREEMLVAENLVAGAKRKAEDEKENPFAKLKKPKLGEDGETSATVSGGESVFVPVTEGGLEGA
jgi:hypothetical protein